MRFLKISSTNMYLIDFVLSLYNTTVCDFVSSFIPRILDKQGLLKNQHVNWMKSQSGKYIRILRFQLHVTCSYPKMMNTGKNENCNVNHPQKVYSIFFSGPGIPKRKLSMYKDVFIPILEIFTVHTSTHCFCKQIFIGIFEEAGTKISVELLGPTIKWCKLLHYKLNVNVIASM